MIVRLEDDALLDLQVGFEFYEDAEEGVGTHFLDTIRDELAELSWTGGIHRTRFGFQFCRSSRFPFGFYYRLEGEIVRVCAILDLRRDPKRIRRILKKR